MLPLVNCRLHYIEGRELKYEGNVIGNEKSQLIGSVLQGKTEAHRGKGRQTKTLTDDMKERRGLWISEIAQKSRDQIQWINISKASSVAANIDYDDTGW